MSITLRHESLRATLLGQQITVEGASVALFKGIKYGTISRRFSAPAIVDDWSWDTVDCTKYGARCPQNHIDIGHLLRLPFDCEQPGEKEEEDEFQCLNLVVTMPATGSDNNIVHANPLPVLIWIHGGSQVVTFGSHASRCCDPSRIVADSVNMRKPIIVVSINYRLNIFAFGDGSGDKNLAVHDQMLAIEWVSRHIKGFGGNENSITLGGESAGAVYAHAHMLTNKRIQRGILMSGTLYLSPPQPPHRGEALIEKLSKCVEELEGKSLQDASAPALLQALEDTGTVSMWIQSDNIFDGWETKTEKIKGLLIGDVEYESVLWRNGIEAMSPESIVQCFDAISDTRQRLALCQIYGIDASRPTASKLGALDFINDVCFAMPADAVASRWRQNKRPVFQYLIDQANPWQASSRAHHAVDLILLFGGYDLSFNTPADLIGKELRKRWVTFINGQAPWPTDNRFSFGPHGESIEIDDNQFAARRRAAHFDLLRGIGKEQFSLVLVKLAVGRLSLNN